MKITAVEYEVHQLELSEPYQIAYETISAVENVVLKIITDTGIVGHGLAAPDMEITGENASDVVAAIRDHVEPMLKGEDPLRRARWLHMIREHESIGSSARAMVDMALYDLLGQRAQLPLG